MPIYDYICDQCGSEHRDIILPVNHAAPRCLICHTPMRKMLTVPAPAQYDENDSVDFDLTGEPVTYHTKGQLKEIAKRHGCELIQ
jgi:putative FmdB family regulatory protein